MAIRFVRSVQDTAWLSFHGILPTADRLARFKMNVDPGVFLWSAGDLNPPIRLVSAGPGRPPVVLPRSCTSIESKFGPV